MNIFELCSDYSSNFSREKCTLLYGGEQISELLCIESGLVGMQTITEQGERSLISLFSAGSFLPLSRLVLDEHSPFDFVTLTQVSYKKIPIDVCKKWMSEHSFFKEHILLTLAKRHQNLIQQIVAFKQPTAQLKIETILKQLETLHTSAEKQALTLPVERLSQQDIADLAGVSRETVSRYFRQK